MHIMGTYSWMHAGPRKGDWGASPSKGGVGGGSLGWGWSLCPFADGHKGHTLQLDVCGYPFLFYASVGAILYQGNLRHGQAYAP